MAFKVAIIGAGPSGTLLARLLLNSPQQKALAPEDRISVTIFEAETTPNFRSQGGTLDLHEKTGLAAMKTAGLFDEFEKHARYDGEAMQWADKKMLCYVKFGASSKKSTTGRPEIDRPVLRAMLYHSLPEGTVKWNHKLTGVSRTADDRTLTFANGKTETGFDLIVGGDGAWSKIRPLVTDIMPFYSGVSGYAFRIPDAEQNTPELYKLVNRGNLFAYSDHKSITAQQMGDGSLNIGTWGLAPADWREKCGYDVQNGAAVKEATLEQYRDWDPRLLSLLKNAEDEVIPRDFYMLPIGNRWEHVPGLTLVGDAAHLMTPFAGEGVNLAFEDSMKLGEAILAAASSSSTQNPQQVLDEKVADFEQDMFRRAKITQQLTYDMMTIGFRTPGFPRNGLEKFMLRAMEDEMGWWGTLVLTPVVYTWFFLFRLIW